jgi:REP element-mobilizing transposase RayT
MPLTRPRLPHFDHPCAVQHVVFRLADALPAGALAELRRTAPVQRIDMAEAVLDAGVGSRAMADPTVAQAVAGALTHFDGQRYRLEAWCVMPTHVHVVLAQVEGWPLPGVVKGWKSFTARTINKALDREGRFWAKDYFDRFMRDGAQFEATLAYVEANPVKAGLCKNPSDWRWSSASGR